MSIFRSGRNPQEAAAGGPALRGSNARFPRAEPVDARAFRRARPVAEALGSRRSSPDPGPLRAPGRPASGFTLVEVLIGMSLSLVIMGAVLSGYVFLGRNFTRSLGISSASQPNLEAQGRRTLEYFTGDVQMAASLSNIVSQGDSPRIQSVRINLPAGSGATYVDYAYNSTAQNLTRTPANGSAQILHTNLLTFRFNYYDASGLPYNSFTDYQIGLKQVSFTLTAQAGSSSNGTLTPVYQIASPRLLLRNKPLLP